MKFGFIGAGNMAGAIIKGMTIGTNSYNGEDIFITSKTVTSAQKLADACGAVAVKTAAEVVQESEVLVLAVKPHVLASVVPALKEEIAARKPLVVSIAAGKTLDYLADLLPEGTPIVRVMPNINAKIGAATTGMCVNGYVTEEQKAVV
ncbi:MAG: NAD(P)-binding domain-containing protein [Anaerotignum sp.]|nr:NAD(P)-binding domain-containing protein [Anaerotignum sp.]